MICEGCKKPIDQLTKPGQVLLLPHGTPNLVNEPQKLEIKKSDISFFCSVKCMHTWCARILEIG